MKRFTPTAEQLESLDDFRAATEDEDDARYAQLAKLLGLPKSSPQPEELPWKHFAIPDLADDYDDATLKAITPVEGVDYTIVRSADDEDYEERQYTDDFLTRREEFEEAHRTKIKAAQDRVLAESRAYSEKREAAFAAIKQWNIDNATLCEAMSNWSDYFWRLDNPEEAAEQDAEEAKEQREEIFSTLRSIKRFLKQPVAESTIGELVAEAYSTWNDLAEEARANEESMADYFGGTKAEQWGEIANTIESFNQPEVPDQFKDVKITYFVGRCGSGKAAQNSQAIDDLDTVIDYLNELEGDEDAAALASDLEDSKSEAESLDFPGWGG